MSDATTSRPAISKFAMNLAGMAASPAEHPNVLQSSFSQIDADTDANIPGWRRYVHLYTPLAAGVLVSLYDAQSAAPSYDFDNSGNRMILRVISAAIPTDLISSVVYPIHRPEPTPGQSVRFTRKNTIYRVGVLATYGRLYGTRFNILFFLADVALSFGADHLVGERPAGAEQRPSEFLVALLWVLGSQIVSLVIPYNTPVIGFVIGAIDRTLWRTAYVALMDDVIGVLTRPHVDWGKATLILVQTFTMVTIVNLLVARRKRMHEERIKAQVAKEPEPSSQVQA